MQMVNHKGTVRLIYTVDTMAVDILATQWAGISAVVVWTKFSYSIPG